MLSSSPSSGRVVVAMSDDVVRRSLADCLAAEGLPVVEAADSRALYLALLQEHIQIALVEEGLPHEGGLSVVRQLRSAHRTRNIGLVMVLGRATENRLAALEAGADALLVPPVHVAELRAVVRNLCRRVSHSSEERPRHCWQFIGSDWKLVSPSGSEVGLSRLESAFLAMLARSPGQPVRRRDIIAGGFGQDPLQYDQRRLEAIVSRLRRKLHRMYPLSQPIKVVHSIGYIFTDSIQCDEVGSGTATLASLE